MSIADSFKGLGKVDFSELDLNNIGSWPAAVRALACLIVLVAVLALGYFLHLTDLQDTLDRSKQEENDLKVQFTSKVKQAANLEEYKEQMKLMEASFEALLRQLPSDTEVPGLLEDITSAGLNSGLEFEEIKLLPEVIQQFYIELPIQVKVFGSYHDLATFVSAVAGMPRIVTLHDFSIKPVVEGNSSRLAMNILVKTYRYNDQGAKQ
ncbi:MAG: type 4a pilus biogenesis protein PilO [Thiopseudomonas sp.]|jgi:type IV pilus assembly protein PilO|nr:type 4a pilus biogenesis protein PilO [Thiopseudomonas sp.]MBP9614824.1 type 4a pilus biogenesis protein PilO [Thiopseudomonas sp.]HAB92736.1 pilus assembly protein PilP [Pseudomonas sp.]HHX06256.1 type 4a pilus biogenesis protein PilO [Pseudomonas sp.]